MNSNAKLIFGIMFVLAILVLSSPAQAQIAVGVSVHVGPPALPVYAQPICPGPGYIWTPGYWAYGDEGYYWVPGTWVMAPAVGLLWTPGYWGWGGGAYVWHAGYWGPHVGFYGGINYGFGYGGVGFVGGEWRGGVYHYNTAVTNINTTIIHNTYRTTVINNTTVNRVSFNGGAAGTRARPSSAEMAAEREHHIQATHMQMQHENAARSNREFLASQNHGHPAVAASAKPGEFHSSGVVSARGSNANHGQGNSPERVSQHAVREDRPPSANNNHGNGIQNSKPNTAHANDNSHGGNTPHGNSARPQAPPSQPHEQAHGGSDKHSGGSEKH
jgi:YXWGXW repeat-containing protein